MISLSEKQEQAYGLLHFKESPITRLFYGGGAGSGKTYLGSIFQISRRLEYPNTRGFVARKVHSDLMKSTFKTFAKVYDEFAFPRIGKMDFNGQTATVKFPNGSEILFLHLAESPGDPEFQSLGSFEFTDGFIDEVGECSENAVNVLYSRIRYNLINDKPAMLLTSNPSYGWLKERWVKDKQGQDVTLPPKWHYIQAKVHDNPDKEFVKRYVETLEEMPMYHKLRLLDGSWDYQINDSPYYTAFEFSKVFKKGLTLDPKYPLYLCCDFNYDPATAEFMQIIRGKGGKIRFVKEIQKVGGTLELAKEVKMYLDKIGWTGVVKVTGDSSGHKKTSSAGMKTDFDIIREVLNIPKSFINYDNRENMDHDLSRDLINACFYYEMIEIDQDGCPQLCIDLQIVKPVSGTNKFYKDREQFKMDALDAFRYGIHYEIKDMRDIKVLNAIFDQK